MGVHISRIQSLELDKLGTSELLLAKNVGNNSFNDIMEANLPSPSPKPTPSSDMTVRKEYITAKYVDHRFSRKTCASSSAKLNELLEAIKSRDLLALIQVYAEGVELMEPLLEPGQELGRQLFTLLSGPQTRRLSIWWISLSKTVGTWISRRPWGIRCCTIAACTASPSV